MDNQRGRNPLLSIHEEDAHLAIEAICTVVRGGSGMGQVPLADRMFVRPEPVTDHLAEDPLDLIMSIDSQTETRLILSCRLSIDDSILPAPPPFSDTFSLIA
jgi:hypothetical protein